MKTTTFVTGGTAALILFWTVFAFVRLQMILTIAYGFAGTAASDHLYEDARMSLLLGCFGASLLTGAALAWLIQRMRLTRRARVPSGFPSAACARLPST
jgi:hypothetical protein